MPTLVLSPHSNSNDQRLWKAATALGLDVEHAAPDWAPGKLQDPVIYGEPGFAHNMAEKLGIALVEPPVDWLMHVPESFLRRDVLFTTLGDAYGLKYPTFVKPARRRTFDARVYTSGGDLRGSAGSFPDDTPVFVADIVKFTVEYRCFVMNKKIVTASAYFNANEAVTEGREDPELNDAILFAHEVVYRMDSECPAAFVLDVGIIDGRGWAVVGAKPCWGSGLSGCNEAEVLRVLRRACVHKDTTAS